MTLNARRIDLVVDRGCVHVTAARDLLRRALAELGQPISWQEWERDGVGTPAAFQRFGSPTILVNGIDVVAGERTNEEQADGDHCRVYLDETGQLRGVPPLSAVVDALRQRSDLSPDA